MAGVVQIVLQVDDRGFVTTFNNATGQVEKLGGTLQKSGSQANVVMTEIRRNTEQAHDAARLFTRTLGIEMPRQLDKFLARSSVIGPALSGAFNVAIVAAFGAVVLQQIPKIAEFATMLGGMTAEYKALEAAARKASNAALLNFATPAQGAAIQRGVQQQIEELQKAASAQTLDPRGTFGMRALDYWFGTAEERAKKIEELTALSGEIAKRGKEIADRTREEEKRKAEHAAQERLAREKSVADGVDKLWKMSLDNRIAGYEDFQKRRDALDKEMEQSVDSAFLAMEAEKKLREETAKDQLRISGDIFAAENAAAIAVLPAWQQSYAQIIESARQREQQVRESALHLGMTEQEVARIVAADWAVAGAEIRNQLASDLERAFDAFISGRIWDMMLANFKKVVFQMVAAWMTGANAMQAATSGKGVGGFISQLLGVGIPAGVSGGVGAGLAPGVIQNFAGGGSTSAGMSLGMGGLGSLSEGIGFTPGAVGISGGGGAQPGQRMASGASFAGLLGASAPALAFGGGLAAVGMVGFGTPARGAISGGILGGLAALGLSMMGIPVLGIGVLLGSLIGALFGIGGRKKKQKQRDEIERQAYRAIQEIKDAYGFQKLDYMSAIAQLEQLRAQVAQQMAQLKWPSRMDAPIDAAIAWINTQEAERQRRMQLQFGPPQFERGGVVAPSMSSGFGPLGVSMNPASFGLGKNSFPMAARYDSGGAVPAILHMGEGVLNRRAMQRVGRAGLDQLNSGGSPSASGGVTQIFQINTIDKAGVEDWLRNGGMKLIAEAADRGRFEGGF